MAGKESEPLGKEMDILEARFIFLLMKKEYRISRSIRMQWFLHHLNKTISVPDITELSEAMDKPLANEPELKVISVVPHEQPPEWKPESSHTYKYLVTAHSTILFLTHNYCIVYCLDMSPSLSAVDIQHGEVMIDGLFSSLKRSLDGLTKPFRIPGSMFVFEPEIHVTVIAHTPFFTTPAQQVLVQGWHVTQDNLETFLKTVQEQLEQLEDKVAEVAGIAYDQLEALRAESEKLVGGLFEESSDGEMVPPPAARVPMVGPDAGFVNMLRYGMLALRLLPDSSCKSLIVVTDGVVASPDVNVLDSVLAQLRSGTVSCNFLHIGSQFHPHCCAGLVPYVDLMQFVADATCGAYLNIIPDVELSIEQSMNLYHEKFLTWRFQRGNHGNTSSVSSIIPPPVLPHLGEWHVSNICFYGSREPHLLRKKQEEDNLSTTLLSVLCCRLREGYTVKSINIRDNHVEVGLVLPWKNHIYLDYTISCQWPDSIGTTSSPASVSGVSGPSLKPWIYSGSGIVHYSISVEAPYEFLHDITCLLKKPFKSQYRQAVVSRFWTTIKNLNKSDQLLVHLNEFPSNPATYTIPESIRSGMPVFYLPATSSSILSASDMTCPQFAQFWKPVCLLEPSVWKKWLHSHRLGLVLQHDRPLPRHLHIPNSSSRFQVIQCRQAAAALYSLLKDWSTFVLIENHSYVRLIHGEPDKPPSSFCIIRVTSKPPCVVINVAFLNGTPGNLRYQIVQKLRTRIAQLTFPQRPSVKEPPVRKLTSKALSAIFSSQLLQEQQQSTQMSPTQPAPTRKWSDVNCCILLHKPIEKILIRYERMPSDFTTVVFPDGTTPMAAGSQAKTRRPGGGLLTTLSRYLHHRRWVWSAQSGTDAEEEAIARVLATITKMRLQEGFNFAHSTAGIINMVLEVQMKSEDECVTKSKSSRDIYDWDENVQPCVIQYVMFPPHMTCTNSRESGSEDEGTDDVDIPDTDADGELQIITECWIEPQHGVVVNCPPERDYMENLPYHKLADVICRVDAECISSLLTFQHLSLMCRNLRVRSPVGISPLNGVARSSPLDPIGYSPNVITLAEQRIHYIPFAFNLMNILPKCQQAELLFSMFIQDLSLIRSSDAINLTIDAPNKLLCEQLFDEMKQIHDKELELTLEDCIGFMQLLQSREREGASYTLPVPPPLQGPDRETQQTHSYANSVASEATMCGKFPRGAHNIPRWKCFLKGVSATHIVLTFIPGSYRDLKLLMLGGQSLEEVHPHAVKLVVLPPGYSDTKMVNIDEISLPMKGVQHLDPLSRSSSCDTSCIFNKLPFASHLQSDSCSPLSFEQHDLINDGPFRMRASSWDTVTKKASQGMERIRTGSMDSKIKRKTFIGPSLRLREAATDIDENKYSSAPVDINSEQIISHNPRYGAITLPVYVYDCPLSTLMEMLVYGDYEESKTSQDIFLDKTFKFNNFMDLLPNLRQCQFSSRDGIGDEDAPVGEVGSLDEMENQITAKQASPETKSEDSDGVPDIPSLSQQCKVLSQAYCKVFVYSLFKSLHLNHSVHALDVQAAVDECEEALMEIDITSFIQTVCGHLKDFCMKAKVDELKQKNGGDSPVSSLEERKFPLTLLQTHAPCQQLEILHKQIKNRFMQILTVTFRPVPSHPEFYFCTPNWENNKVVRDEIQLNEKAHSEPKTTEPEDELENMTFHSEIVEFRSEHGSNVGIAGMGTGAIWEGQAGLVTPDDARTSLLSNMDSDSVSELPDEDASEEVSPLFLHLTCSVRSRGKISSCSVKVLPTCLGELVQTWESDDKELDLKELKVTLDVLCLTLSEESESDEAKEVTKSVAAAAEEPGTQEIEEQEPNRPFGSFGSEGHSGSSDPQVQEHTGGVSSQAYRLSQLRHLPEYQLKAVTSSIEKIEWLMRDEIAAFLLDTYPLDKNTLSFVAEHVTNSPGRTSCLMERVPLQFVFGPEQSLGRFLQEFKNISFNGYHLCQEDELYYLVRDKHSTSDSVTGANQKKTAPGLLPLLDPVYPHGHTGNQTQLWAATTASSECEDARFIQNMEGGAAEDESDTDDSKAHDVPNVSGTKANTELLLEKALRTSSGSDEKPALDEPNPWDMVSPGESMTGGKKYSQSYGFVGTEREISPTRWSAVQAWQRRQQGTPGHRSEVSSIVESALGTEDGYEGYAGDSSDSGDDCDWVQDLDMRRPSLPKFWLIMKVEQDAVTTYFHCRCAEGEEEAPYKHVQRNVVAMIKQLCKVVNQTMLLQNLHDTRLCDQLLEPEASEDIWKPGADSLLSRAKSLDESQRQECEGNYLEATLKFMPGWFACSVVWETHFSLHPRLKTGPGKPGFSRGIQALRTVLNRFSVTNRKNMFVYQDNSGNVFYLRLDENVRPHSKNTPPGDTEDNLPGLVSRSSSIASLNTRKPVGIPIANSTMTEEAGNQGDTRPRVQSFGERELFVQTSSTGLSSLTGLSSSEGNATTPTPCVTPQPMLSRSEDTVVLKVHGISEAGPQVKEELVQVLQNRLDDAVLEVLSVMLARNPMCKLTPDDVHFVQKPFRPPEAVIQFSIQSHALPHLQALAYYLRQNLLQFLYIPKYTDARPECHFQDYSEPESSSKRVTDGDLFLYNQSASSGSRGIGCIAVAVVDSEGNLVKHSQYPKPHPSSHEEPLNRSEFETLTLTQSYGSEAGMNRGPGPVALLEFRIWKQGRVNIDSLTVKLRASVRHATWDLLMEFRLLTAPLAVPRSGSSAAAMLLPSTSSEPSTPSKAKKILRTSDSSILERTSFILADTQGMKLDAYESGEAGVLHEVYRDTMRAWLEFGVDLSVPSVRKQVVTLAVRHPLAVMVRELQNLVTLNAPDTSPLVFWGHSSKGKEEIEYLPGPFMGLNFTASPMITRLGENSSCLLVGRNLVQWKACVSEDSGFEPDVLDPKNAQKVYQKFSPLLSIKDQPLRFVPRQRLLLAELSTHQVVLYTYNWSKERADNFHQQLMEFGYWLSARSSLLTSILTQKMGLFHNQLLTRKQQGNGTTNGSGSKSLSQPPTHKVTNPYLSNLGDVEQLVKFPVVSSSSHKDSSTRRVGISTPLGSAMAWRDVFRDGKPRRPILKTPTNTDPVICHVHQMLETRHFDRKAEEQKKLYMMWQSRGATPNIPLSEDMIHLFKQNSRVIHYCLTPLLFLPRWRVQSAATRDHALSTVTATQNVGISASSSLSRSHHSHHSHLAMATGNTGTPSPTLRRHSDDKWHSALCASFVHEYKQYLQTLGFIPIQTEPSSPRKGAKGTGSTRESHVKQPEKEKNVCYLQKSLLGGILMFEILLCEPFFHAKLHALECSRLQSKPSSALISQFTLGFLDECDKIKILMHLHSFTYDYHLRSVHGYVSGHHALLKQGYHLTHFLDDFLNYYSKAPNFARNLVYADVLTVHEVTTPARQLFNYLLSHEKAYSMDVFRMVPAINDAEGVDYDTDSHDNEYVLVQLESTPHVTYKDVHDMKHTDDFDATLIVAHDHEDEADHSSLHIKYYIILTSRRELYPKLEMERKLGKFCTVSTASVTSPMQLGHVGGGGELDSGGVGMGSQCGSPQQDREQISKTESMPMPLQIGGTETLSNPGQELVPLPQTLPEPESVPVPEALPIQEPESVTMAKSLPAVETFPVSVPVSVTVLGTKSLPIPESELPSETLPISKPELVPLVVSPPILKPGSVPLLETLPITETESKPMLEPVSIPMTVTMSEPVPMPMSLPISEPVSVPVSLPILEPVSMTMPVPDPVTKPMLVSMPEPLTVPIPEPKSMPLSVPMPEPLFVPMSVPEPVTSSEQVSLAESEENLEPASKPENDFDSVQKTDSGSDDNIDDDLDSNPEHAASVPTPTQHIEIRQEEVNYLGYYSSHEQLMQQLILEQANSAKQRIHLMVSQGMVHCRTHLLWNKLQCAREPDRRREREREREDLSLREMLASTHGLTYSEFCELRSLAIVEPLSHLDPRLSPLLCQPLSWYQALAKVLMSKYSDHYRMFLAPDGNEQHIVILHHRYVEAFVMLSLDMQSLRGDLAVVYQKPLPNREQEPSDHLDFCLAEIQSLIEGFVNACCFHLWVGLL